MIKISFASPLALAALLAAPAFAQTAAQADVSSGTTTANGAYVAPLEKAGAKQQAAMDPAKQARADATASGSPEKADVSRGTTTANGAYVAPLEKAGAKQQAAMDPAKQAKADSTAKSTVGAHADVSCGTTTANGAYVAPLEKAGAKQTAAAEGKSTDEATVAADCVPKAKMAKKKAAKTASSK
jgi:hypothetical protein